MTAYRKSNLDEIATTQDCPEFIVIRNEYASGSSPSTEENSDQLFNIAALGEKRLFCVTVYLSQLDLKPSKDNWEVDSCPILSAH